MSSGLSVLLLAVGGEEDVTTTALYYFLFAAIFLTFSLLLFFIISRQKFYRWYSSNNVRDDDKNDDGINYIFIIKHTWMFNISIFLVYFVTMSVYPAIHILAQTTTDNQTWEKYFLPVGAFLLYNCLDFTGRLLAAWLKWPKATKPGGLICLIITSLRISFIPLLMFCNIQPRTHTHAYFKTDSAFLTIHALFSLSSGYMTNINMMNGPCMVSGEQNQSVAASMMVFMLVFGLFMGACFSYLWVMLL